MTSTPVLCRLCLSEVKSKHSTALFSGVGLQQNWPSRLRELLLVSVSRDDGLPSYICRSCVGKVETLERKLTTLRQQAHQSILKFQATAQVSRKRPKDTSSEVGVSPATAKARPPAKRMYAMEARQLFSSVDEESSSKYFINAYIHTRQLHDIVYGWNKNLLLEWIKLFSSVLCCPLVELDVNCLASTPAPIICKEKAL